MLNSTCIKNVFYDFRNRTLVVSYSGGSTYAYYDVSKGSYLNLIKAKSPGTFVNNFIKPKHECLKINYL